MKNKLKVGIIHSSSGTMSFSETPLIDAALMAIDEINRSGGVLGAEIMPIVEDCKSDPRTYAGRASRLIKRNGVKHLFGCWTSASRKAVKPMVEKHNALLWYPVQYEGLEASPNIVYTGSCLNQQIEPAVKWAARNLGATCYLVGSDYVFPRTANKLIRTLCSRMGLNVAGERYLPLGTENFEHIVDDIMRLKPDVVFNTINGDSNLAFYYHLHRTGNTPGRTAVMAFSIGEVELKDIGLSVIGHYACSGYFQSLETPANREFIRRFAQRYGPHRAVSDAVVNAYVQPFLWKRLVEKGNTFNVGALKKQIAGIRHPGPSGTIEIDANHHAVKPALIGSVNTDLQFDIVWQHPQWIQPLPWLGLEHLNLSAKEMVKEALAVFPETLEFSSRLKQETEKRKQAEADLKKEQAALKEQRSKYQALLKAVPAGIVIVDIRTGRIHDCNPWFENLVCKGKTVLRKQSIRELTLPDEWATVHPDFFELKKIGDGRSGRITFNRSGGRKMLCRYRNSLLKINGRTMLQSVITLAPCEQPAATDDRPGQDACISSTAH